MFSIPQLSSLFLSLLFFSSVGWSVVPSSQDRVNYIYNAQVWEKPSWISNHFTFSNRFQIQQNPDETKSDIFLNTRDVECTYVSKNDLNGKTPKFYCQLSVNGRLEEIKVKYGYDNGEIYSEVLGSRLLWALGFKADLVYPVKSVICRGCPSSDPWNQKTGPSGDYRFDFAIVEKKHSGKTIAQVENQGWAWSELLRGYESQNLASFNSGQLSQRREMKIHRDALRLLMVFLQHADNKPEQQRLVCRGGYNGNQCHGQTALVIQDLGAVFGGGASGLLGKTNQSSKANSREWKNRPIWKSLERCQANMSQSLVGDSSLEHPIISEEGRLFLAQLLTGFSSGSEGRRRVQNLFRFAKADYRMALINKGASLTAADIDQETEIWTEIFNEKVNQLSQQNFKCPLAIEQI